MQMQHVALFILISVSESSNGRLKDEQLKYILNSNRQTTSFVQAFSQCYASVLPSSHQVLLDHLEL